MNARDTTMAALSTSSAQPITPALIQSARLTALAQGRAHLTVLEDESGLASEAFTVQLGMLFAYPTYSMTDMQAGSPAFDMLSYTDCAQHDCILMRQADAALVLIIGNPFADDILQWANYAINVPFTVAL